MSWREADTGLWVATHDDAFGGSVDRVDGFFTAYDLFGRDRGTFPTLPAAQKLLEAFMAHPSMSRRTRAAAASPR